MTPKAPLPERARRIPSPGRKATQLPSAQTRSGTPNPAQRAAFHSAHRVSSRGRSSTRPRAASFAGEQPAVEIAAPIQNPPRRGVQEHRPPSQIPQLRQLTHRQPCVPRRLSRCEQPVRPIRHCAFCLVHASIRRSTWRSEKCIVIGCHNPSRQGSASASPATAKSTAGVHNDSRTTPTAPSLGQASPASNLADA